MWLPKDPYLSMLWISNTKFDLQNYICNLSTITIIEVTEISLTKIF